MSAITERERASLRLNPWAWPFLGESDENCLEHTFCNSDGELEIEVRWRGNCGVWTVERCETGEETEAKTLTEALAIAQGGPS